MKNIVTLLLLIACTNAFAQDSLKTFNNSRNHLTATGLEVLSGWGIANIGVGAAGWANSSGGSNKYFYQINTIWGAANLGIALLGINGTQKDERKVLNKAESLQAQQKIEKTFLINGGLDLVYIGAGIYLEQRGNTHNSAQLRGYGTSVILQGAFLLLFDGTMYSTERSNGTKLRNFLIRNPVTFDGRSVGLIYALD